ncbi:MAG: glycosyltransferase family 2 protein, partial [Bacteroidales bacterium]|nr:glycosyltransferase family 2 protein [Bacteroidales bacterium]
KIQVRKYLNRHDIKEWLKKYKRSSDTCVIYSSKDREEFTLKTVQRLLKSGGNFEIVWIDGSEKKSSIELMDSISIKEKKIVGSFKDVSGGPDIAIMLGLRLAMAKKYKYVVLLENDTYLSLDWLKKSKILLNLKSKKVGACCLTNYENHNLVNYKKYSIIYVIGASCVIFKEKVVKNILKDYGLTTSKRINNIFSGEFGKIPDSNYALYRNADNYLQGADWKFASTIYNNGYLSLSPRPTIARNLDAQPKKFKTRYL